MKGDAFSVGLPSNGKNGQISAPSVVQQQTTFKKTKLCTFFESGFCPRGDICTFAHGQEQLGTPQPPMGRPPGPGGKGIPIGGYKKTRLCNNYEQGFCPRGDY